MYRATRLAALLAAATLSLPAAAQFAKPEDAIKYRKSAMFMQSQHLGRIFGMATGRVPFDAKVVLDNATMLDAVGRVQFAAFVDGSDKGDTKAKPEIWSERAKFDASAQKAQEEINKLLAAAKTGNPETLRAAAGAVGGACKSCHDTYRKD